jgi:hypothetical protein
LPFTVNGESKTITAGKKAGTGTVKVKVKDSNGKEDYEKETLEITVVEPNGIGMVRHKDYKNVRHKQGLAGVEFLGAYFLLPSDVSFCNLLHMEGSSAIDDGKLTTSGYFKLQFEDEKKAYLPFWDIIKAPSTTPRQKEIARQILTAVENNPANSILIVEETKFGWHRGSKQEAALGKGIASYSEKPNTLINVQDRVGSGHFKSHRLGITTTSGYIEGHKQWNISQTYWIGTKKDENMVSDFSRIDQTSEITEACDVTLIKGGASATAKLNDPTSTTFSVP